MTSTFADQFIVIAGASLLFLFVQLYLDIRRNRTDFKTAFNDFIIFVLISFVFTYVLIKLKLIGSSDADSFGSSSDLAKKKSLNHDEKNGTQRQTLS